ncbi:CaiB/BaiF CoA transferase family protein [Cupriavidus pauculus]|uniref:CaiB/BaiF CoA transferase family protein n=1 Tax=Cupriavidus pauculus TaxID=82633 RepID=UPI001FD56B51|nr:CoA transferase [Cupriavidus pauculus]
MNAVLNGVRVLDLTQMVAGPLCTLLLGDLGADVIKVEPPTGDTSRNIGLNRPGGESDYFLSLNRNKRSVVLDLKSDEGIANLRELAAGADIVVENFRPGTMEKLGIGYESLRVENPGLIFCSLSGFGQTGPYRERPALDPVVQAMSGLMQLNGTADSGPLKTGILISDFVPPLFGTIGVIAALLSRKETGLGQRVDVAMLDATVFSMLPREQYYFSTGKTPERSGNAHYQLSPWNTYETSDGRHLMIVAHTEKYWRGLLGAIGRSDLAENERFTTNDKRMANREDLDGEISSAIAQQTLDYWVSALTSADVLFSPVRDFEEVFSDPVVRQTIIEDVPHPTAGVVSVLKNPIRLSQQPTSIRRAPPLLGEHTQEVLSELHRERT